MKIAIKVLTEWDRLNVIAFFEKHYNCSGFWSISDVLLGDIFWVRADNKLYWDDDDFFKTPSDYTILQGVPKELELPKVEIKPTREQELEECLQEFVTDYLFEKGSDFHHPTIEKAVKLLNQK